MSKLILYLGSETFTLDVKQIEKNEEHQWRYWNYYLNVESEETVRLVRYLGYCRFEPVYYTMVQISKTEEDVRGFFGGKKVVTNYWFRTRFQDEKLSPRIMYLEE